MNTKKKGLTSFLSTLHGGDEGSRTPVRKSLTNAFYECSRYFESPAAQRLSAGSALWQPLNRDRGKGVTRFTFTANRRLYPGRGAPGKDGRLN